MIDVSIIIVNYNTKKYLKDCLNSIYQYTKGIRFEVIVSDNASSDGSVEMLEDQYPQVICIRNHKNLGFGKANNVALRRAKGTYVFYLNSDTVLLNNAVKLFYDFWERHKKEMRIGCLGAWLLDKSGQPIHSCGSFPTPVHSLLSLYHMYLMPKASAKRNSASVPDVEYQVIDGYVTGADLFLKNDKDALFDERFFMYDEESDLEYNHFRKRNKKIVLLSAPKIIHLEGASDTSKSRYQYDFARRSHAQTWISRVKYLEKNHASAKLCIALLKRSLLFIWSTKKYRSRSREYRKELRDL